MDCNVICIWKMADCSYARCKQERAAIRRELSSWSKDMVHIVGKYKLIVIVIIIIFFIQNVTYLKRRTFLFSLIYLHFFPYFLFLQILWRYRCNGVRKSRTRKRCGVPIFLNCSYFLLLWRRRSHKPLLTTSKFFFLIPFYIYCQRTYLKIFCYRHKYLF